MTNNSIFIAATGQNVGKTTSSLGIFAALNKHIKRLGFIKPVGQRHRTVSEGLTVDKDVVLFREFFKLPFAYQDLSPVILPQGATQKFLDGQLCSKTALDNILKAYKNIEAESDFVLVEGTGHVGVGSIVGLSNAQVAKMLNLSVIIIAQGGIGSTFDELTLNKQLCDAFGVRILGVILNKVLPEKREKIAHYVEKALKRWDIPLLGVIPYEAALRQPSLHDYAQLFKTDMIAGEKEGFKHFAHSRVVATSCEYFSSDMTQDQLVITPATRKDIISEVLNKHSRRYPGFDEPLFRGLVLTGATPPDRTQIKELDEKGIPCIYVSHSLYEATQKINSYVNKISPEDTSRVLDAISLIEENVDLTQLLEHLPNS